jgi:peptidoglycan/LPS O-acetylase OafA/YrhL
MLALICYGPSVRMDHAGLYSFWGNADLLSFGCLAAILERYFAKYDLTRQGPILCVIGSALALVTIVGTTPNPDYYWSPTIIGLGAALFLFGAAHLPSIKPWRLVSPITWLLSRFGQASYEIYLFHVAMIIFYQFAVLSLLGPSWHERVQSRLTGPLLTLTFMGAVLALGLFVSRRFTEPMNKIIRSVYAHEAQPIRFKAVAPEMAE